MALSATVVWEVRTTGGDANGGGFNPAAAGADRSLQDAAQVPVDNVTITATTAGANSNVLTFTGYTPTAADVGNVFQATGGTNINAGFYEITGFTAATWTVTGAANLTTAGGAGSAITGNMGGALASPGKAGSGAVGGNTLYVQAGTYSITSVTANVAGGCLSLPAGTAASPSAVIGYSTTRAPGNMDTRPTLQASGINTFTLAAGAANYHVEGLILDGANLTASKGFSGVGAGGLVYRCKGANCKNSAFNPGNSSGTCLLCEATGCSVASAFLNGTFLFCTARANTTSAGSAGFQNNIGSCGLVGCVAANTTGTGTSFGFILGSAVFASAVGCLAYGNSGDGFSFGTGAAAAYTLLNCRSEKNGGYGYNGAAAQGSITLINCSGWSNTPSNVNNTNIAAARVFNFIACSADPSNNAAGNDFSLNNTALGGALLRAAGIPGALAANQLPGLSTLSYPDVGAAQSQGGGGIGVIGSPIVRGLGRVS